MRVLYDHIVTKLKKLYRLVITSHKPVILVDVYERSSHRGDRYNYIVAIHNVNSSSRWAYLNLEDFPNVVSLQIKGLVTETSVGYPIEWLHKELQAEEWVLLVSASTTNMEEAPNLLMQSYPELFL